MARTIKGLTLIEIIVSMLILSLVLIMVLNLFPTSMAAARQGEQLVQADTIAGSLLDEYAAKPFQQLIPGLEIQEPVSRDHVTFHPQIEILELADSNPDNLKSLKATVTWEYRGQTRTAVHELWVPRVRR